jgi:hypothetical protein
LLAANVVESRIVYVLNDPLDRSNRHLRSMLLHR